MTVSKTIARIAALGLCVVASSTSALADPGKGNGNGPATTPPGHERKAEQAPPPAVTPVPAPVVAAAPETKGQAEKAEHGQRKADKPAAAAKSKSEAKAKAKPAAMPDAKPDAKPAAKPVPVKAKTASSGSYKETSSGTDLKKGMSHKHTICHATGSASNPYVVITPSVSGVFHGHMDHQGDEDIVPPYTYKGVTYSQNWDAEGQAIFANGCAAPTHREQPRHDSGQQPDHPESEHDRECPGETRTERVLVGIWHATGAYHADGTRKYVLISPSAKSAHWSKHEDDVPAYETRTVVVTSGEHCDVQGENGSVTPPQHPALPQHPATPQQPAASPQPHAVAKPTVGRVDASPISRANEHVEAGGVLGAVSPSASAVDESAGGVLGAVSDAPAAIAKTATTGTLPFTGLPLWIVALVGGGLIAAGLAVRRST